MTVGRGLPPALPYRTWSDVAYAERASSSVFRRQTGSRPEGILLTSEELDCSQFNDHSKREAMCERPH
jgi:hypothetical protein